MEIYTILINCFLLFIWETKNCSGQGTDSSDDISKCATYPECTNDKICVETGRCGRSCENGGTCCNTVCRCPDRYSGTYCEYESFIIEISRTIHLETANEVDSDLSIPFFNKSINTKTSPYFKVEPGCEYNIILLQEVGHQTVKIMMEDKENEVDDRIIRNDPIIHVSCDQFRKFNISIRRETDGFTLGTVQMVNNTFLRKTIIRYTKGKITNQATFSSARKTEWTFYETDTVSSTETHINVFNDSALLCPILPEYIKIPLHVSFLNRSSQWCRKNRIKTACDTRGINIEYTCSDEREKCTDFHDVLWIAACHTTTERDCKSCKIKRFKSDIPKICQITENIRTVTYNLVLAADNCFDASRYLIIWNEIRDVFPPDQYSSQRPSPTAGFLTTLSDSASYTTVEDQSPSTKVLQTTRSLTPTYSEHVSVSSTAGDMLKDDNKRQQISDNEKVIGLTVGASVSAAIIVILLICLLLVLRRRSIERKSAKKNQTVQNSEDGNDYTRRQNIALPMQEDLTEYNELAMRRDSHQYGELTSVGTKPNETTYDYIDHHIHKQETDICKIDKINSMKDPGIELVQDYSVLDPNEKTLNTVMVMSNTERDGDAYAVLDPDESTTLCSGADSSNRLGKPLCESNNKHTKKSTCSHTQDEAYAVLDPNITGFDRTENVSKNESHETYTVLDPSITGFNRSNEPGKMTKEHVNKNGLVRPFKEDGTDYEFAKPIDDNRSSKSSLPSYRDRTNSGGTYQTGNTHRRQDIHQQNPEENVYNRTVDDVYDSAAHTRKQTSRDDTYDHFSGEKIKDCG
ncbi:uncharacterized protein [Mytilus edulis]|uniref:uncharacterized protein n=1 Tax=Mytilus edulis TaxID=6550 RepID=UPI0039EFF9A0